MVLVHKISCVVYWTLCCCFIFTCHHVHLMLIVVYVHSDWLPGWLMLHVLVCLCLSFWIQILLLLYPPPWFAIIYLVYFPWYLCFPIIFHTSSKNWSIWSCYCQWKFLRIINALLFSIAMASYLLNVCTIARSVLCSLLQSCYCLIILNVALFTDVFVSSLLFMLLLKSFINVEK